MMQIKIMTKIQSTETEMMTSSMTYR